MIWKIVTLVAAGLALWAMVRRAMGAAGPRPPASRSPASRPGDAVDDYAACPSCGAWTARGAECPCRTTPIP